MGARWYEGSWAAFLSRDTVFGELSTPMSLNRYTYAYASPLDYWDPDGRISIEAANSYDNYTTRPRPAASRPAGTADSMERRLTARHSTKPASLNAKQAVRVQEDRRGSGHLRVRPVHAFDSSVAPPGRVGHTAPIAPVASTSSENEGNGCWAWARSFCSAAEDTGDWLKEHPGLVHLGVSVGVGAIAVTSAAAACVGTVGIGCPVAAAAAIGMLVGTPAHLFTAEALDEEVTAEKGFGWMVGSALSPMIRTVVTTVFQINVAKRMLDIVLGREPVLP
jgi:hypothetical protein